MRSCRSLKILLAVLVLGLPSSASSSGAILKEVRGKVLVRAQGEKKFERASAGAPLLFGDEIKSLRSSSAHVVFSNGDVVLIKQNTQFILKGDEKKTFLSFSFGEFLIGLKRKLGDGESFQVKTPAAVAAVRGTLFWGLSDDKSATTYASFGNFISITAAEKTILLEPGEIVKIPFGLPPEESKPSGVALTFLDTFGINGSIQGLEALVDLPK